MEDQKKRASSGTVDLPAVISDTLDRIQKIDNHNDWDQSEKTRRHRVLAESVKNQLHEDGRKRDENKVSLATYRRYLTDVRKAITGQNLHHHNLDKKLDVLARRYQKYSEAILSMRKEKISDTRLAHRALLDQLLDDPDAYNDLKSVIIDHEIMRHLSMASAQKSKLAQQQQNALAEKKHNTVEVDKDWLLITVKSLLNPDIDGNISFARLALGIAFATGRRAVEVLYQGEFEKAGKYEVRFAGFAKKRGGADYEKRAKIYTLVPADDVISAINLLRQQPEIIALHDEFGDMPESDRNRKINHRTAANLNSTARRVWADDDRVFRDSRAVWARFVFEEHFRKDPRWRKVDEDVFWHEQLGHEDLDTQQAYKQFKLVEREHSAGNDRLSAVRELLRHPDVMKRGALQKITNWCISALESDPASSITQHRIITELGSGRPVIKDWLAIADEALSKPAILQKASPKEPKEPEEPENNNVPARIKTEKPRIRAVELEGWWMVTIDIGGQEHEFAYRADKYKKNEAISESWNEFQCGLGD